MQDALALVTGALTGSGSLASSITGTSSVTVALIGTGSLASVINGTSTVVVALNGTGALASVINGTGTVSGTLIGAGSLASVINGTSVVIVALSGSGALASSISGTSVVTAALSGLTFLASVINGTSAVTGTLTGSGALASTTLGSSIVVVSFTNPGSFSAAITGSSSVVCAVSSLSYISASINSSSSVTGQISLIVPRIVLQGFTQLQSFGVSSTNPSIIQASSELQLFNMPSSVPGLATAFPQEFGSRGLGALLIPGTFLMIPYGTAIYGPGYTVVAGYAFSPVGSQDTTVVITLYQNVFNFVGEEVQEQSYPWASTAVFIPAGEIVQWQIIKNVTYVPQWGSGYNQSLQLSVGVNLQEPSSSIPTVQMTQFELQS